MSFSLTVLAGEYAVHRLTPDAEIPPAVLRQPLFAVLRSTDELSLVCPASLDVDAERSVGGWACLRVNGPLDFELTGIMASLTTPLAAASVPVFVISSFDTDYVLVPADRLGSASDALTAAGFTVD